MNVLWCDTETTGLKPENSGIFEIALVYASNGVVRGDIVYKLNPLTDIILYHESAAEVHGVSEEEIRSFPIAEEVIPKIDIFLSGCLKTGGEKLIFAGYNPGFDYDHMDALFTRYGFQFSNYIAKQFDVMDMVKRAVRQEVIPYMENLKLGTVCKSLNVPLKNAHTAKADIIATRNLCAKLYKLGVKL